MSVFADSHRFRVGPRWGEAPGPFEGRSPESP